MHQKKLFGIWDKYRMSGSRSLTLPVILCLKTLSGCHSIKLRESESERVNSNARFTAWHDNTDSMCLSLMEGKLYS